MYLNSDRPTNNTKTILQNAYCAWQAEKREKHDTHRIGCIGLRTDFPHIVYTNNAQ
jgi:hypothetical protein